MVRKEVDSYGTTWHYNEQGQLHNDGDEPAIIWKDGTVTYCKNGQEHRDGDLPAVIQSDGYTVYYKNDRLHCLSGPARIYSDGTVEYWIHNEQYTKEEFDNHPLVREYRLKKVVEDLLK